LIYLGGGAKQRPGTDYSVSNGLITFVSAPASGVLVDVTASKTGAISDNLAIALALIL
jgi:hypothetical protein